MGEYDAIWRVDIEWLSLSLVRRAGGWIAD